MISIELAKEDPTRVYQLMSGLVIPRPIAFVSTVSRTGIANLAPFSYFNIGGINPPSLTICTVLGPNNQPKDTYMNVLNTGEFVVNLVTRDMAEGMNKTAPNFPHEVDEWLLSGFTSVPSQLVKPARVAESPVQMECKLYQTIEHGCGSGASRYIIGEIALMHVLESIVEGTNLLPAHLIARLGNSEYLDLAAPARFELERPTQ